MPRGQPERPAGLRPDRQYRLRVQGLADPNVIITTEAIVGDAQVSAILHDSGITSASRMAELQGIGRKVRIFALS